MVGLGQIPPTQQHNPKPRMVDLGQIPATLQGHPTPVCSITALWTSGRSQPRCSATPLRLLNYCLVDLGQIPATNSTSLSQPCYSLPCGPRADPSHRVALPEPYSVDLGQIPATVASTASHPLPCGPWADLTHLAVLLPHDPQGGPRADPTHPAVILPPLTCQVGLGQIPPTFQ